MKNINYNEGNLNVLLSLSTLNENQKSKIKYAFSHNDVKSFIDNQFVYEIINKIQNWEFIKNSSNGYIDSNDIYCYLYYYKNKDVLPKRTKKFLDDSIKNTRGPAILIVLRYLVKHNTDNDLFIVKKCIDFSGSISNYYLNFLLKTVIPNMEKSKLDICMKHEIFKKVRYKKGLAIYEVSKDSSDKEFESFVKNMKKQLMEKQK